MPRNQVRATDISVDSMFLVEWGKGCYPVQVEVLGRSGNNFRVRLSTPASPRTCDKCGHGRNLSMNTTTGVVVCMAPGCGKNFGYRSVGTTIMKSADLIPYGG